MTRLGVSLAVIFLVYLIGINAATRVARSPQFAGASSRAQAGGYGFGPPPLPPPPPPRFGGFSRRFGGTGLPSGSISISKSISISNGGSSQSSSSANAGGFGK